MYMYDPRADKDNASVQVRVKNAASFFPEYDVVKDFKAPGGGLKAECFIPVRSGDLLALECAVSLPDKFYVDIHVDGIIRDSQNFRDPNNRLQLTFDQFLAPSGQKGGQRVSDMRARLISAKHEETSNKATLQKSSKIGSIEVRIYKKIPKSLDDSTEFDRDFLGHPPSTIIDLRSSARNNVKPTHFMTFDGQEQDLYRNKQFRTHRERKDVDRHLPWTRFIFNYRDISSIKALKLNLGARHPPMKPLVKGKGTSHLQRAVAEPKPDDYDEMPPINNENLDSLLKNGGVTEADIARLFANGEPSRRGRPFGRP